MIDEPSTPRTEEPGFFGIAAVVDSSLRCVITRMRLRRPWHLVSAYRIHRSLRRAAQRRQVDGLLKTAFLVEGARTCYSLSIWDGEPMFSGRVPEHVKAVNKVFALLAFDEDRGPELWSTTWRLDALSHNQRWDDLDLIARVGRDRLTGAGMAGAAMQTAGGTRDGA